MSESDNSLKSHKREKHDTIMQASETTFFQYVDHFPVISDPVEKTKNTLLDTLDCFFSLVNKEQGAWSREQEG